MKQKLLYAVDVFFGCIVYHMFDRLSRYFDNRCIKELAYSIYTSWKFGECNSFQTMRKLSKLYI